MAANWVGPGRGRKSTRPGANGVVELSPFEFLVPPPRKHRHPYHVVFAPNHKLRRAVTALDNRECRQAGRGHDGRARIAWPKLMARVGGVSAAVPELWR